MTRKGLKSCFVFRNDSIRIQANWNAVHDLILIFILILVRISLLQGTGGHMTRYMRRDD